MMEGSRLHVLASVSDDAATGCLKNAFDRFGTTCSDLFDEDRRGQRVLAMASAEYPFQALEQYFDKLCPLFGPAYGAVEKRSTSGLHVNAPFLATNLNNVCLILDIGKCMLVRAYKTHIGDVLATNSRSGGP